MYRYAVHAYKSHFTCFVCRRAFKKTAFEDYQRQTGLSRADEQAMASRGGAVDESKGGHPPGVCARR